MDNLQKYEKAFIDSFELSDREILEELEYNSIEAWDSIGHMNLIGNLEDEFGILMEMDDIIDLSSYKKGMELLKKYDVDI